MILLKLFGSFFQIGLFSIGGGYAALPLIQNQVVELNGWLSLPEFTDLITISQMTPGPIAINSATFVGIQIAGIPGAIISTLGCVFPSCIIVSILAYLYYKYQNLRAIQGALSGLRPAVVAMIASAGLSILITALWGTDAISFNVLKIDWMSVMIFATGFIVLRKWKPNPIWVMMGAGVTGVILSFI